MILLMTVFVFNQIIRLSPKSLYMDHENNVEEKKLKDPFIMNTEITQEPRHSVTIECETCFTNCSKKLKRKSLGTNITINSVYLHAKESRFVSQASTSRGFINVFYDLLQMFRDLLCACGHEDFEGMNECCYHNMCFRCCRYFISKLLCVCICFVRF